MNTLYVDPTSWDLVLDTNSSIALASEPYSLAQDVASAVKTFSGECYYDTTQGIPYWASILGAFPPPLALLKAAYIKEGITRVPDVADIVVFFSGFVNRKLTGQLQITSVAGSVASILLGTN